SLTSLASLFTAPPPSPFFLFPYTTLFRSRLRDPLLRLFNDFACRFPCGRGKHGDIVFRHDDRATTSVAHSFLRAQSPEIFPRISDRKSTRLNSSHVSTSYAVFCLKKKKKK